MSARAKYAYGKQDLEKVDVRYPAYIMNMDSNKLTSLDKDRACCTELILNC